MTRKPLHSLYFSLPLFILLFSILSCSNVSIKSHSPGQEITIDGKSDEWLKSEIRLNEKLDVGYAVSNTDESLNLLIRFDDPQKARLLNFQGLKLWLHDKSTGIYYVNQSKHDRFVSRLMQSARPQNAQFMREPEARYELDGDFYFLQSEQRRRLNDVDTLDFAAAAGLNQGIYTLEFRVPLSESVEGLSADKKQVKLGLQLGGLDEDIRERLKAGQPAGPAEENERVGMGGNNPLSGTGGRGGMSGPPPGGTSATNRQQLAREFRGEKMWFKVKLAH